VDSRQPTRAPPWAPSATLPWARPYLSYEVSLGRLDPIPITGRTIARGDYLVTLVMARGSSAASERW